MRYRVLFLFTIFLFSVYGGNLLLAQDDFPDIPVDIFITRIESAAFLYPTTWAIEEDDPRVFFATHESVAISVLIQLAAASQLPIDVETFNEALDQFFAGAGYGPAATYTLSEDREGAIFGDSSETVLSYPLTADTFVLMFIDGDESLFETYEADIVLMADSLVIGEDVPELQAIFALNQAENGVDTSANTDASTSGFTSDTFDFPAGTLAIRYPEAWLADLVPDIGLLLTDAEETFFIAMFSDVVFGLENLGAQGNLNDLTDPTEIVAAALGDEATFLDIASYTLADRSVAKATVQDDIGDSAIIAFQLETGEPFLMFVQLTDGDFAELEATLDAIIASISLTP